MYKKLLPTTNYRNLQQAAYPGSKWLYMFLFNPMLKHSDIMNKISLPTSKTRPLILNFFGISLFPNVPACQNNHFHKERLFERGSCLSNHRLQVLSLRPLNLQVIPYSLAEIALKKQMHSILISSSRAKHTIIVICHLPVPPFQQISGVQSIIKQQPCKKLCPHNTTRLPDPSWNICIWQTLI